MENLHALNRHLRIRIWLVFLLGFTICPAVADEAPTNTPARVTISGFGFFGNRDAIRLLRNFQLDGKMPSIIDRTFVEDAILVLLARARDEGYLLASLSGEFTMTDGSRQHCAWTNALEAALPRDFAASDAHFQLNGGVRFYYHSLEFEGLKAFSKNEAGEYFFSGDMLLKLRGNRVFSPAALTSSLAALRRAYATAGYQDAVVNTNRVTRNDTTGEVTVEIVIEEGLPTIVRSVTIDVEGATVGTETPRTLRPNKPYSSWWQQDLTRKLQAEQHVKGFPDAAVEFSPTRRETNSSTIELDLAATVTTGPLIRVGKVTLSGNVLTRKSVLESRISLNEGAALNRVAAEKSRQRLAHLGVFDSVRLRYQTVDDNTRDVLYEVDEGKPVSLSALAGYGSYEQLRGGLEFENRNSLGLAHDLRLRAVQSFKSSKGDLLYTVPDVFGENLNLFTRGSGLWREEVSFTRVEYGGALGLQKRLTPIKTDLSLRYDYEFLNAQKLNASASQIGPREAKAAAFVLEFTHDGRDNPLSPRRGLRLFNRMEFASASLGGDVDYQRVLLGISYHLDLKGGRLIHLGLTHGVSFTVGSTSEQLPFNKRFFPGGENSVRGYQEGEASPLDASGQQLGAETYTQANIEFEQLITRHWSIVTFFDAVGFAQDRSDYPWNENLYSTGGGLRWRSPIGPVRLEYGYNLRQRKHDPAGTLHFSIGFPF